MRAIQTTSWEEGPRLVDIDSPPTPSESQLQLRMEFVGLHFVVRSRASGKHYSASSLPHTLGIDGVGVDEATGKRYFVISMAPTFGTALERINVERSSAVPIPDGADAAAVAASVNPGMSGWLAIRTRTSDLPRDFTVLILGATSASGELAASLARSLGAGTVIGVARSAAALEKIPALDRRIEMKGEAGVETDYAGQLDEVDVILDYVCGDAAAHLLQSLPSGGRAVQYVQIGTLSGQEMLALSAPLLRSKNLTVRGSGPGAFSLADMGRQMFPLVEALAGLPLKKPQVFPIEEFEKVWADKDIGKQGRIVLSL